MRANLTLDQFEAMIAALQAFLNEGKEPFDDSAFPLNWQPKPAGQSGVEAVSRGGKGGRRRPRAPAREASVVTPPVYAQGALSADRDSERPG